MATVAPRALLDDAVSLSDLEKLARPRLPHMVYEFVAAGAGDEVTLRWNRAAFDGIKLCPRVLEDVTQVDTSVALFDHHLPFPILLAPAAYQRVLHPDGELATAQGAGAAGAVWVLSTGTTTPLEEIARVARGPLWFQLFLQADRGFTSELVALAERIGCRALVLTVDTPVLGARDRQLKAKFNLPADLAVPYLHDVNSGRRTLLTQWRVAATWRDVDWLRSITQLPVLLKGIMSGVDAARAVDAGVSGIVVSNHGGRNLDTLPATVEVLPEVVQQVKGRIPVLVDGGIRRGTDVLKAIALGAQAVLIGRPYLFGLALAGAAGVQRAVQILHHELELAMALCGRKCIRDVDRSVLWSAQ